MPAFSTRLTELKLSHAISSIDLASHLGIPCERITLYENAIEEPTIDELIKISKVFGVSVDYLLGLNNCPKPVFDITGEEKDIIEKYRVMAPKDKKIFMDILYNIFNI